MKASTRGKETVFVGVGIAANIFERANPFGCDLSGNDPGNVTQKVTLLWRWYEIPFMPVYNAFEMIRKIRADLIAFLPYHGPQSDAYPFPLSPQHLHGCNRLSDNVEGRTLPPRMGAGHDTRNRISRQHRSTIR